MAEPRYTCPCCGFRTLSRGPGDYDLCPVCFWEDDGMHGDDAASRQGPNGMALAEGQRLYRRYGASALHCLSKARPPAVNEPRDPDWQPQPRPANEVEAQHFLPDLGQLLMALTEDALARARDNRSEVEIGRFRGLREALSLLVKQADSFGLARRDVGIDPQLDLKWDLLLDPRPGRFAG
jgi:Cysteine-rich CPCC